MAASVTSSYFPETGNSYTDGLLSGAYWNLSSDRKITWSLADLASVYVWNEAGYNVVQTAFDAWEAVLNIDFVYTGHYTDVRTPSADIVVTLRDNYFFGNSNILGMAAFPNLNYADYVRNVLGETYASYPHPEGDMALNVDSYAFNYLNPGSLSLQVILHEIGHAIGLKHPHDGGLAGYPTYSEAGISSADNGFLTLMSYDPTSSYWGYGNASTPMPFDILAAQAMYGKNTTTNSGDNTYYLRNEGLLFTIWDVSGNDSLDARYANQGVEIHLDSWSAADELSKVFVAIGTNIENAVGSNYADYIYGNEYNNELVGYGGDDFLKGNDGDDNIFGEYGDDKLEGGSGNDQLVGGDGNDKLWGDGGTDSIWGEAGNDAMTGNDGDDFLYGGSGNDTIYGRGDYDLIVVGTDNDTIYAGPGDDVIWGDVGNDYINGGTGTDAAYYLYNKNNYTISPTNTGIQIISNTGNEGTDILDDVEFIHFSDVIIDTLTAVKFIPTLPSEVEISFYESEQNQINYFLLSLSKALTFDVIFSYKTSDGMAVAGEDYISTTGIEKLLAGQKSIAIPVEIIGDSILESNETFNLHVYDFIEFPNQLEIVATHTIINDDIA